MSSSSAPPTTAPRLRLVISQSTRWLLWGALVLFLLASLWRGVSFARWALAAHRAGALVEQGLEWPEPRHSDDLPSVGDATALERALEQLGVAHRLRPHEAWPLWQTARIHTAREAWRAASAAYDDARARDPRNPLLAWEAGLLSFELLDRMEAVEPVPLTERIAAGDLTTPDTVVGTPYCAQGSCYSALTTVTQPMAAGESQELVTAPFLFLHPPAQITQVIELPERETTLAFLLGLEPAAASYGTDGVVFEAIVGPEQGEAQRFGFPIGAETLLKGWTAASVDLSPWAGQRVSLTLSTLPGPSGKSGGDWVGWGAVELVPRTEIGSEDELKQHLREAWEQAGISPTALLHRAERARTSAAYDQAERWFRAANALADVGASGLHHMAWTRAKQAGGDLDITLLREAVTQDAGWGSPSQRIEAWMEWGQHLQQSGELAGARDAYHLVADAYGSMEGAEGARASAYQRVGEMQLALGEVEAAAASFQRATRLSPEASGAHLGLGRSLLAQTPPDLDAAAAAFEAARAAEPENEQLVRAILDAWHAVGAEAQISTLCSSLSAPLRTEAVEALCLDERPSE